MQRDIVRRGLALLADAPGPRTTVQTPYAWGPDVSWREKYMKVTPENIAQLRREGDQRRSEQQSRKRHDTPDR